MKTMMGLITLFSLQSFAADLTLTYDLHSQVLGPGQTLNIDIPAAKRNLKLDFVALTHRQDPHEENECHSADPKRDCLPAYNSLEILSQNPKTGDQSWRYWAGFGSGPLNSKFSEIRAGVGETDNLYDWRKKGHCDVDTRKCTNESVYPQAIRIRGMGKDSSHIEKVIVKFLPPRPDVVEDVAFSNYFAFGDYETADGRKMPKQADDGYYENALEIGPGSAAYHPNFPKTWDFSKGEIIIPLKKGMILDFVDVAVGDMRPAPYGADPEEYRGNASMSIRRTTSSQNLETMMERENIGSNGIMRALPNSMDTRLGNDEFLRLHIHRGTAYIMGIRIGYRN